MIRNIISGSDWYPGGRYGFPSSPRRAFVSVAEELYFNHAAARHGMIQPSLNRQIPKLKEELVVQLFQRIRHSVALP